MRRSTLVVLVLFGLILAVYLFLQKNPLPKAEETTAAPTPQEALLSVTPDSVIGIRIQDALGGMVQLTRQGTEWQLTYPVTETADSTVVGSALQRLSGLMIQDRLTNPPSDELMGFNQPIYTITLLLQTGQEARLVLGSETPLKTSYYARLDSRSAVVVAKAPLAGLVGMLSSPPRQPTPTAAASAP